MARPKKIQDESPEQKSEEVKASEVPAEKKPVAVEALKDHPKFAKFKKGNK